jgi:hypothetical protein
MAAPPNEGRQLPRANQRLGDRVVHGRGDSRPASHAVVLDAQRERVEDLPLHVGSGAAQSVAQVGKPIQVLGQPRVVGSAPAGRAIYFRICKMI